VDDCLLHVVPADGTEVAIHIAWFPRLRDATQEQRNNWLLIGEGVGIHSSDVESLLRLH